MMNQNASSKNAAKRKVIISERDNIAALMEGDKAIEFIINRGEMLLGDVYLAQVENILPSIDAAFVNVGGDKMGFLHSSDVQGRGELKSRLQPRQRLIVQVMKEPTGHKGPRVTTNISLPGRFLVLMPGSKGISVSRKIETQAERSRLKSICSLVKASGIGVIVRTEAQGQTDTDILEDFEVLLERWQNIVAMADSADPPALLYRDQDLIYRVVRELVTEHVDELIIDTSFGAQRAQQLLQNWNLDKTINVQQYNGQQSIMVTKGVEREIRQALQTKVPLPSGGYLYIQPTEALTVVDVNSGRFTSLQSQAQTIKITNLEATREIARQLRLRNIGGMVIVDFIDMESRADQLAVLQAFENELAPDKAKPQVGQLTDLGLVEMTRHRQGQALSEIFGAECKECKGSGQANVEFTWTSTSAEVPDFKGLGSRKATRTRGRGSSDRGSRGGGRDRDKEKDKDRNDRDRQSDERQQSSGNKRDSASKGASKEAEKDAKSAQPGNKREAKGEARNDSDRKGGSAKKEAAEAQGPEPGNILRRDGGQGNESPDYAELIREETLVYFNADFANRVVFSFPPRSVHQTLMRYNAKATNFMTLLNNFRQRDDERDQRQKRREERSSYSKESEEVAEEVEASKAAAPQRDETPQRPVEEEAPPPAQPQEAPAKVADEGTKPVMLAKLAEQLRQKSNASTATLGQTPETETLKPAADAAPEAAPAPQPAKLTAEDASHLINDVVLPFVDALRNAEGADDKASASRRFLLDVNRMTPVEKMFDEAEGTLDPDSLEQLGIPEVPLPFEVDTSQGLLHQLVEVAEQVVKTEGEAEKLDEAETVEIIVDDAKVTQPVSHDDDADENDEDEDDDDGDDEHDEASGESLDEIIKKRRHALNKKRAKSKKRTTQNHKKKKR